MPARPNDSEEFARLRSERDSAYRQLSRLQGSIDTLSQLIASQNDRLDQVVSMLRRRETQLKRSEAEVRKLRRKLGLDDPEPEPTSEPVPTAPTTEDAPVAAGADDPEDSEASPTASSDTPIPPKVSRPRSGGRRPPPSHLPTDSEHHEVCACGTCGGRVFKRDVLTLRLYTVVPTYVRCREINRERVICANPVCNEPTTAQMPPLPCNRALYDCQFLAWLVVMKFMLLVPLDRIRTLLLSQGVNIAMSSLVHLIERAADLAGPIDGEHMKQLRAGAYMHFDGTGLKVLVLGQTKAWDGYLEVFTRDELTVFQFDMTKHADNLRKRIRDFAGILICDAESRNAAGAPLATLSYCNAHPLRAFRDAERVQPHLAAQGKRFIEALYDIEDEATRLKLWGEERIGFRQRRSRRVLNRFQQWLQGVVVRISLPSDPIRKIAKYYLKHFADLTRFVDDPNVLPLDNNAAEREFQRHAKLRQASLFAGSPEGAHRWAVLLGIVRTAQKCDLDVLAYLTWMFERRGSHRKAFAMTVAELTPLAYKELASTAARAAA